MSWVVRTEPVPVREKKPTALTYFLHVSHLKACCFQMIDAYMVKQGKLPPNKMELPCQCGRIATFQRSDCSWLAR